MELNQKEYAVPAEEPESAFGDPAAERVRARADMAACPVQTWMVPIVDDMDKCLRERFRSRILREVNDRLADGRRAQLRPQGLVRRNPGLLLHGHHSRSAGLPEAGRLSGTEAAEGLTQAPLLPFPFPRV